MGSERRVQDPEAVCAHGRPDLQVALCQREIQAPHEDRAQAIQGARAAPDRRGARQAGALPVRELQRGPAARVQGFGCDGEARHTQDPVQDCTRHAGLGALPIPDAPAVQGHRVPVVPCDPVSRGLHQRDLRPLRRDPRRPGRLQDFQVPCMRVCRRQRLQWRQEHPAALAEHRRRGIQHITTIRHCQQHLPATTPRQQL